MSINEKQVEKFFNAKAKQLDLNHLRALFIIPIYDDERLELPSSLTTPTQENIGAAYRLIAQLSAVQTIANSIKDAPINFSLNHAKRKNIKNNKRKIYKSK